MKHPLRQLVDWHATFIAGAFGSVAFLIASMLLIDLTGGSPWAVPQYSASLVLGSGVIPPQVPDFLITLTGILVHFVGATAITCLVTFTLHRWGMVVGFFGGALIGLALYFIQFYGLIFLTPWFAPLRSWIMCLSFAVFGACAGAIYELLEVERFEVESA